MQSKERPMLYSTDMVVSILADRKTKTRRTKGLDKLNGRPAAWRFDGINYDEEFLFYDVHGFISGHDPQDCTLVIKCPYGKPGDILWVRETWTSISEDAIAVFKADYNGEPVAWNWKPSIHMPKV